METLNAKVRVIPHKNKKTTLYLDPKTIPARVVDNAGAHFDYMELCSILTSLQQEIGQTPDTTSTSKQAQRSLSKDKEKLAELIIFERIKQKDKVPIKQKKLNTESLAFHEKLVIKELRISPSHIRRKSDAAKIEDKNVLPLPSHKKTASITVNRQSLGQEFLKEKKTPLNKVDMSRKSTIKKLDNFVSMDINKSKIKKICITNKNKDFNFKSLDNRKKFEQIPINNSKAYKKIVEILTPRKIHSRMELLRKSNILLEVKHSIKKSNN